MNEPSSSPQPSPRPEVSMSPVPHPTRPNPPLHPLSGRVIVAVAAGIAVATVGLVVVLWWAGTRGLSGAELVTARFDALRAGLSIGIGGGGVFALFLAWRRQKSTEIGLQQKQQDQADVARAYGLQERIAAATEADAAARRITELYTKAAEQLGSDKAPVRLAGIYALGRLAQDNSRLRQTVVDVLCAYLRMPFTPPAAQAAGRRLGAVGRPLQAGIRRAAASDRARLRPAAPVTAGPDARQEQEVRLTAQRVIADHLRPGPDVDHPVDTYWGEIDLDLTGATLIDLDLGLCTLRRVYFGSATFAGHANFTLATFTSDASFTLATFTGEASFDSATFTGPAWFNSATFTGPAWFRSATFFAPAWFELAGLPQTAFSGPGTPSPRPDFGGARFATGVPPDLARFVDGAAEAAP